MKEHLSAAASLIGSLTLCLKCAVYVNGRAGGWPDSYSTQEAGLWSGSKVAEPEHWLSNTYKLLGEHPRSTHFTVFALGLLQWLHCNS